MMFAVWSLGSQPFWLATRMCRSRMESWKDNIRKISRDPVKHQHWLQDKKLCEKKNSPIIFAVLGQQKYFAFSWLQFQLIVVETVEIILQHFIPLWADFSWTAGRLFLNVDPKPSPLWRQLHHHLIAAGHSKKDESGLLFWVTVKLMTHVAHFPRPGESESSGTYVWVRLSDPYVPPIW